MKYIMVSVGTPEVVKTNRVWSPNIICNLHVKRSHTQLPCCFKMSWSTSKNFILESGCFYNIWGRINTVNWISLIQPHVGQDIWPYKKGGRINEMVVNEMVPCSAVYLKLTIFFFSKFWRPYIMILKKMK